MSRAAFGLVDPTQPAPAPDRPSITCRIGRVQDTFKRETWIPNFFSL